MERGNVEVQRSHRRAASDAQLHVEESISDRGEQSLASPCRCRGCFGSAHPSLCKSRGSYLSSRQRDHHRRRSGARDRVYRSDAATCDANGRQRCNRICYAPFADADAYPTFVRLFLFLAYASIRGNYAASSRRKRLSSFVVELASACATRSRFSVSTGLTALWEYIFCHAAAFYRAVGRALAFQATKRPQASARASLDARRTRLATAG